MKKEDAQVVRTLFAEIQAKAQTLRRFISPRKMTYADLLTSEQAEAISTAVERAMKCIDGNYHSGPMASILEEHERVQ